MHQIILFDLDGTLLDTSPGIFSTANYTMRALGLKEQSDTQLRKFVGPPLAACFRVACGMDEQTIPKACDIYRAEYTRSGSMFNASIYDGIPELLETLQGRGYTLGVATLKLEDLAQTILAHFGLASRFSVISGADHSGSLTKADIIEHALRQLAWEDHSRVLMVGDTPHDMDGAITANVDFVGVDWGFGFSRGHNMEPEGKVLGMIDTPSALLSYL
ncbi:HAD-IA family hydrolase [Pleomorphochaeta sp. DL1XJH-081]|jgi:phosphoglycolate phosphatase|uniref:HAD-IA family hydrolase n=1 Tax=Pleomorphochaeta sp. DL1XJH-081 TaxID=3409690 RepID=UPI003BB74C65